MKKYSVGAFLLHAGLTLHSAKADSLYPAREWRLGGRVKIEFFIPSWPDSFRHFNSEKAAKLTPGRSWRRRFRWCQAGRMGEEIIHGAGYRPDFDLLFLPVLWCLPTAFAIQELSSSLPARAGTTPAPWLGNFWGFQKRLSLAASIFDMAIYRLFVFYEADVAWFGREPCSDGRAVCGGDARC
jgi:hypothetical protein